MIKNYFTIALRNITSRLFYSSINISGLIIGIMSMIIIISWAVHEYRHDEFHLNKDRIYTFKYNNSLSTVPPLMNVTKNQFPEIQNAIRISCDNEAYIHSVNNPEKKIKLKNILYPDADFDKIFTCKIIKGNLLSTLNNPNGIILTKKTALKLFEKTDVIGKVINYKALYPPKTMTLTVGAVIDDFPSNSFLKFEALISFLSFNKIKPNGILPDENWRDGYCNTYVLLNKGIDANNFNDKLNEFGHSLDKQVYGIDPDSKRAKERELNAISLHDVYFFNNNKKQLIGYLSIIGLFILVIAVFNYINLSVAKLLPEHSNLLIRRIHGASRLRIMSVIFTESVEYSIIAAILAIICIFLFSSQLSGLLNIDFHTNFLSRPVILLSIILSSFILGIIAGLYPALKLSANNTVNFNRQRFAKHEKHLFRQFVVVIQFVISIFLIVSVLIISKQFKYLNNKELGFDNKQIIYSKLNSNFYGRLETFKERLLQNPNIISVSGSQDKLGEVCVTLTRKINGTDRYFQEMPVDPDYINTMGFELIKGRNFAKDLPGDEYQTLIINETAVKDFELDLDNIIGTEIYMYDRVAKVIGVIKDFHFESFHHKLDPFMLYYHPGSIGMANIKISGNNIQETIGYINNVWYEFSPDIPFEYHFLDKTFEELYKQDRQFRKTMLTFSAISIFIACLGLLGLVWFTIVQRTKEIGVRKVNGACNGEVTMMLLKEYLLWIVISFIMATPISYFIMKRWLENFAYKTTLNWWIFALGGLLVLVTALITVSWQSWQAARRNPVEALRYE